MLIAHITDTHVVTPGSRAYRDQVDTNTMLERAVDRLNALYPRPDCVIITGDLTDHGLLPEYAELTRQLARLEIPYYLVIGNHDHRATMLAALDVEHLRGVGPFVQYTVDHWPVRLIMLDSTSDEHHMGEFCEDRCDWLKAQLAEAPDRPTIVALHHPPFDTGITMMDACGAGWADGLAAVLADHPNVLRVLCGHIHRSIQTLVGGRLVSVCPSTAHQVTLDLAAAPSASAFFEMEPPAFQLHFYRDGRLVTHTAPIERFREVEPLAPEMLARLRNMDPRAMMMKKDLVF
jgi:3',5'-cyclic AMP phosphodiesterase CpdA